MNSNQPLVACIYACDENNAIGLNNQLLCHLPADLQFFKKTTMGSPVIMGRKTYESIGRLLPGRRNIIITRNSDYRVQGADIFHSLEHAIASCDAPSVFVIGGGEIYKQAFPITSTIYRTLIHYRFEADTVLPEIDSSHFQLTWEEAHAADEKNSYAYTFQKWERKG
jgi:dihydrofolate reductase